MNSRAIATGIILVGLLTAAGCTSESCQSEKTERELMGSLYKMPLDFGDRLKLINDASLSRADSFSLTKANTKYYILHYFLSDCDKCIEELIKAKAIISRNPLPDTKYVFLANGPTDIYIKQALARESFPYPVYFEPGIFTFKIRNKLKLDDVLYNTMLVNNMGKVLLFGSYYDNKKAQDLFEQIVNCK
jgi:hypothetical protein